MSNSTVTSRFAILGVTAAIALSMTACSAPSSSAESAPTSSELETTDLTVGIVPVADLAGLVHAVDAGYFEDEGLSVTVQPAASGGALGPALISGDLQASSATWPSWFLATQNAAPLRFVGLGVSGTEETAGVYTRAGSGIDSPDDLEGKTIAVNSLKNTGELTIRAVLDDEGVDSSEVTFTELPFPDMIGAASEGNVDAVWLVEPFATAAENAGLVKVMSSYTGPTEAIPVSGMAMTADFVANNPNTTAAFARALERGNADLAADPDLAREIILGEPFNQKPEVANSINLPVWVDGFPTAADLEIWNDLMGTYGLLASPVDLDEVVYQP